jgi:hypothetical protein
MNPTHAIEPARAVAAIGQAANTVAARHVFADYRQRKA